MSLAVVLCDLSAKCLVDYRTHINGVLRQLKHRPRSLNMMTGGVMCQKSITLCNPLEVGDLNIEKVDFST